MFGYSTGAFKLVVLVVACNWACAVNPDIGWGSIIDFNVYCDEEVLRHADTLFSHVNESAMLLNTINSGSLDFINGQDVSGPHLRLGIISYATKNIRNYTAYSAAVNLAFALHHRYSILFLDEQTLHRKYALDNNEGEEEDSRWLKVKVLREALDPHGGWGRHADYILWVDADLVFIDFSFRIEQLVADNPAAHILASAEHAGSSTLINSGSLLVRNTRWSRRFLDDWWSHADRRLYSDQEQFDLLYEYRRRQAQMVGEEEDQFTDKIAILAPDRVNSDPPAMTRQQPHNQVLHLMGEHSAYRVRVFRSAVEEICRCVAGAPTETTPIPDLAPQLTLHRENLLKWALEEYAVESKQLLEAYEQRPLNSYAASRDLANSVHHFAHALSHLREEAGHANEGSDDTTTTSRTVLVEATVSPMFEAVTSSSTEQLRKLHTSSSYRYQLVAMNYRKKVYHLLRMNLNAWKHARQLEQQQRAGTGGVPEGVNGDSAAGAAAYGSNGLYQFEEIRSDWPELLKITAIAGQHILGNSLVSMRERRHVSNEILEMMREMLHGSNPQQHDAILLMVADVHQQIGLLDLEDTETEEIGEDGNDDDDDDDDDDDGNVKRNRRRRSQMALALQHFKTSLKVTTDIAQRSGQHLLVTPLTLTANALSSLGHFAEAEPMFRQAIMLTEGQYGPSHLSILPLLVNFGISLVEFHQKQVVPTTKATSADNSRCLEARGVLARAISLLESATREIDSKTLLGSSSAVVQRAYEYFNIASTLNCVG